MAVRLWTAHRVRCLSVAARCSLGAPSSLGWCHVAPSWVESSPVCRHCGCCPPCQPCSVGLILPSALYRVCGSYLCVWVTILGCFCPQLVACLPSFFIHIFYTHTVYALCTHACVYMHSHVGTRGQPAGLSSCVGSGAKMPLAGLGGKRLHLLSRLVWFLVSLYLWGLLRV